MGSRVKKFVLVCLSPANPAPPVRSNNGDGTNNALVLEDSWEDSRQRGNLTQFSYDALRLALRYSSYLGMGAFGTVRLGVIDGREVAIKTHDSSSVFPVTDMLSEINCLGQLQHPNLVKVIGFCHDDLHNMLVYEYMENGSLDRRIYSNADDPLTWLERMRIALGAARGLDFVHTAGTQMVLQDFKTSNILLDQNLNAKLSDFGCAIKGPTGNQSYVETEKRGTKGYADPYYLATGYASSKTDVYSFGVVLLEMLAGRKVIDDTMARKEYNLVEWGRSKLKQDKKLLRLVDSRIKIDTQDLPPAAMEVAKICHMCLRQWPGKRPHMSHVVHMLETVVQTIEANAV